MPRFKNKYRIQTTRLPGWDYASEGWYFLTICTRDRQPVFGHIAHGIMHLSTLGQIASRFWEEIPQHTAANVSLDAFVVMPDHIHGIIAIHHPPRNACGGDAVVRRRCMQRLLTTITSCTKGKFAQSRQA